MEIRKSEKTNENNVHQSTTSRIRKGVSLQSLHIKSKEDRACKGSEFDRKAYQNMVSKSKNKIEKRKENTIEGEPS